MANSRVISRNQIEAVSRKFRRSGKQIVFTNGVFDILHRGHIDYLSKARALGDLLIVGLNSDTSVRRLKGSDRPFQTQADRAAILLALRAVDYVIIFGEETPQKLIEQIRPHVLVKGADYKLADIVGAEFVKSYGGRVRRIALSRGRSSSKVIAMLGNRTK